MHALLGRPELSSMGYFELWTADARAVAISHCGPSLEVLQQRVSIPEALRSIQTCLWKEFVEGHLQGRTTNESTNFWNALAIQNPQVAQEAHELFHQNVSCTVEYDRVKIGVVEAARSFFHADLESAIIRPLACIMDYIPANLDVLSLDASDLAALIESPSSSGFLQNAFLL